MKSFFGVALAAIFVSDMDLPADIEQMGLQCGYQRARHLANANQFNRF